MKDVDFWRPTKFVERDGRWFGSPDRAELGVGSRFIGDIVATRYQRMIEAHVRGRLLDLGCGKVPLYGMYKTLVDEVVCVDWEHTQHVNRKRCFQATASSCGSVRYAHGNRSSIWLLG